MAIQVASLVAKLDYDDNSFQKGMDGSESRLSKFGGIAGAALATAAAAVAAGVGLMGASMMKVEDALTPVMTLTGKGTQQFEEMSKGILGVVKSSPKSADELGMAAYTILSAGISDTTKATQTLKDANALALAGLGSVPEAVNLITSAMNSWKDANLSSTDAAQILFGTIAAGKTTTAELAQGFGGIAPLASSLGVSFKDLMAVTAALTATGMPASQAYAGLKAALSNIIKPSEDAIKTTQRLGLDFGATALKTRGLIGFFQSLAANTDGTTQTLTDLFGSVEGVNVAMALMGPQAKAMTDNLGIIDEKGKGLNQTAKEVSETFSNRIKIMKNNVMVWLAEIGNKGLDWLAGKWEEFGPRVKGALDSFTAELDGVGVPVNNFWAQMGDWVGRARDRILGYWDNIKTSFNDFMSGWTSDDNDASTPSGFFQNLGSKAEGAKDAIKGFFSDIGAGFAEFNAVLQGDGGREKKEGWLGGVDALGLFVRDNLPRIEAAFQGLQDKMQGLADWVSEHWPEIKETIAGALEGIIFFLELSLTITQSVIQGMAAAWRIITEEVIPGAIAAFNAVKDVITGELGPALGIIKRVIMEEVWPALQTLARVFTEEVMPAMAILAQVIWGPTLVALGALKRVILEEVVPAIKAIPTALDGIGRAVVGAFRGAGSWLVQAGRDVVAGFISGITSMFKPLTDKLAQLTSLIPLHKGPPSKDKKLLFNNGQYVMQGLMSGIDNMVPALKSQLSDITATVSGSQTVNNNFGGPGLVTIQMPSGSNGDDVVRALKSWQSKNGRLPLAVTGRTA